MLPASLFATHAAEHVSPDTDIVVYSIAVGPENLELRQAGELGIPTISYAEMLGRLMADRRGLAVAGTHGKSTTAAMAAQILIEAGMRSDGRRRRRPAGGHIGRTPRRRRLMLVEACEYRGNFLHLRPQHAAILGIEPDHFDCYDSLDAVGGGVCPFAGLTAQRRPAAWFATIARPRGGRPPGRAAAWKPSASTPQADWSARNLDRPAAGRYRFEIHHRGEPLGKVDLSVRRPA